MTAMAPGVQATTCENLAHAGAGSIGVSADNCNAWNYNSKTVTLSTAKGDTTVVEFTQDGVNEYYYLSVAGREVVSLDQASGVTVCLAGGPPCVIVL